MNERYCTFCKQFRPVESYSPDHAACWDCIHNEQTNQEGEQ